MHAGVMQLVKDLNRIYRELPALHQRDCSPEGFQWIDASDAAQSVLVYLRKGDDGVKPVLVILNFTPMVRERYRIGVPGGGHWDEVLNSDSSLYGGSNVGNFGGVDSSDVPWHGQATSIEVTLPPLGALVLVPADERQSD